MNSATHRSVILVCPGNLTLTEGEGGQSTHHCSDGALPSTWSWTNAAVISDQSIRSEHQIRASERDVWKTPQSWGGPYNNNSINGETSIFPVSNINQNTGLNSTGGTCLLLWITVLKWMSASLGIFRYLIYSEKLLNLYSQVNALLHISPPINHSVFPDFPFKNVY